MKNIFSKRNYAKKKKRFLESPAKDKKRTIVCFKSFM